MAQFEGKLNLNVETSEIEIKGKFKLTEEELATVTGGDGGDGGDGGEESTPNVVIDNGTGYLKAGFSGEEGPRSAFPTVVSQP